MKRLFVLMTLLSLSLVGCNRAEQSGGDAVSPDTQMEQEGTHRGDLDAEMGSGAGEEIDGDSGAFGSGVGEDESLDPQYQEDTTDLGTGAEDLDESEVRYEDDATLEN